MRARLNGIAQSLVDVEIQAQQVAPRMEPALTRGGDAAEKALEDEDGRMSGHLQSLTADVAVAGRELDELGKPAPSSEANE